jgi:two-component system nitrate/nitrite response regulator NarL
MAPPRRIRVYLADDHPLFLESMASAVRKRPGLEHVGSARNGLEALDGLRRLQPDVAVVDLRMPGLAGDELVARAAREGLATRILVLTGYLEDDRVYDVFAAGAGGYLSKEMDRERILEAVEHAASGDAIIAPDVQSGLVREIQRREALARPRLSARELQVLALAAQGFSTPEIAAELRVSAATVKSHLQKIFDKLGVADRTSAVVVALRRGLLD